MCRECLRTSESDHWPRTEGRHRRAAPTGKAAVSTHRMLVICDPGHSASPPAHANLSPSERSDVISIRIDEVGYDPGHPHHAGGGRCGRGVRTEGVAWREHAREGSG